MSRSFSVLLVEDDDPLRDVLVEYLHGSGFVVHATDRGDAAVELAHRVRIDFSILDFHLPGLSGLEVFRRIADEIRPLPAILMSGAADPAETRAAIELGFVEFLPKPLDLIALRRTLDQVVRRLAASDPALGGGGSTLPVRLQDVWHLERLLDRRGLPRRRPGDGSRPPS